MRTTYTDYTLYRAQRGGRSAINAVVAVQEAIEGGGVLIYSATEACSRDMRHRILRGLRRLQLGFWDSDGTLELESGGSIHFEVPGKPEPQFPIPVRYLMIDDPAESEP